MINNLLCIYHTRIQMNTEEHIETDIKKIREQEKVLGIKDWLKILIIFMIPIVNIVMWIVWLVSEKTNLNLKNYLIASLILIGIFLLLWIILFFGIFGVFTATQI